MMKKIKHYLSIVVLVSLIPLMTSAAPYVSVISPVEDISPPSLADHLHLSHSKDPVDGGWLANLTGLPNEDQILRMQPLLDAVMKDEDPQCKAFDGRLKKMVFQHFLIYQQMANAQQICLDSKTAHQWAHILAMIIKESYGDSTNITAMSGRQSSTHEPLTNLPRWYAIADLTPHNRIPLNYQTNFGLTQMSADRLTSAFRLAKDQTYDSAFLEGREGAATPRKIPLNTAIAVRRLIWFYQDVSQGRIMESDGRIHQQDINNPAFSARYQAGLNLALLYCGTPHMFQEGAEKDTSKLKEAISTIAYCKLGNPHAGYGRNEVDEQCFAKWVTLCPALNIDIANLTPLSYFVTRNTSPVCEKTFNQLIHQNANSECKHFGIVQKTQYLLRGL